MRSTRHLLTLSAALVALVGACGDSAAPAPTPNDAADTTTADAPDSGDSGAAVDADDAGDAPTSSLNACGGEAPLRLGGVATEPGDPCGCGGSVVCDGVDDVVCSGEAEPNACGGCGELPGVPGESCGECEVWACDNDSLQCVDDLDDDSCDVDPPPTCAALNCDALGRDCDEGEDGAVCGHCEAGLVEREGLCVPFGCPGDDGCPCDPDSEEVLPCNVDTGTCTRGVRICDDHGEWSPCIVAPIGRTCDDGSACDASTTCDDGSACEVERCESNDDCGVDGHCVDELLYPEEGTLDDCTHESTEGCARSVCRYLRGTDECDSDDDCDAGACVRGRCEDRATLPIPELCNGLDDDCDGAIDNDAQRIEICGLCPFNMVNLPIVAPGSVVITFVCVDRYEASRPDANDESAGANDLYTLPRPGVIPWTGLDPDEAESACRGEGLRSRARPGTSPIAPKRLCAAFEWEQACGGSPGSISRVRYPYSESRDDDDFVAGACVDGSLDRTAPAATGTLSECCRGDICDAVGNVAEYVIEDGNVPRMAGGSFRDTDESVLACDRSATMPVPDDPASRDDVGFRCCTPRAR